MSKHKKFIFLTIIFTFLLFSVGILIRYIIDPVGINNKFNFGLYKDVALAYRTQKFVELNKFQPNTLMIGGSRVQYLRNKDVEFYTKDKVYNLGLSYSTMEEEYYFLKYSLENFDIKNVVIGLNLYPFSEKLEENNSDFDKNLFTYRFNFYQQVKHYLEIPLFKYLKFNFNNNLTEPFYKDGGITQYHQNIVLKENWEKRKENSYKGYHKKYENYLDLGETNFNYLKLMVKLCKDKNVNLKVFTTVIHTEQLEILKELHKENIYYEWKKELSNITPYYDFMYKNEISNNDKYFIDTSHIKQEYGIYYFDKIFDNKNNDLKDFGVYVDKDNIEKHLKYLKLKNGF